MATIIENQGDASTGTGTRYTLSLSDVFQGTLDPGGDEDWVRVELTAGTIYDITLTAEDTGVFALVDSAGNHVIYGGYIPSGYKLIYSPSVSGTYYLRIGGSDLDYSIDYELSLIENGTPEGTHDEIANYLTHGYWEDKRGEAPRAYDVAPGGILTADITALTAQGQQLARWALESWTYVTGIEFEFVDDENAHILFDDYPVNATGITFISASDGVIQSSEVVVPINTLLTYGTTISSFTFKIYLHEIGHALGLGHAGPYEGIVYYGIDNIFLNDSQQTTVMSYFPLRKNTYIDASGAEPVTPMVVDIIAIHNIYGAPTDINTGDTVYGYRSNVDGYLGRFFGLWSGEENPFSPDVDVGPYSAPAFADVDGDNDFDIVVVTERGDVIHYLENTGTGTDPNFTQRTGAANPLDGFIGGYNATPAFADLDGDADPDLIVVAEDGAIHYFENTGTADSPGFTQRTGAANPLDGIDMDAYSTATFTDLDGDSDPDIIVGKRYGTIDYYENTGTAASPRFTQRTGVANPLDGVDAEIVIAPVAADLDVDGDPDLVVVVENGVVRYFDNTGTATSPEFMERVGDVNPLNGVSPGRYGALAIADLDADGDPDLIATNQNTSVGFYENTGTPNHPVFTGQLLGPAMFTLYDNGGTDTLDLRTDTDDERIDLRAEATSDVYGLTGNLVIARGTLIENVVAGSGDDQLTGNAVANYLRGRYGNDTLFGGDGDDILEGGAGADRLIGGAGGDWVSYRGSDAGVTVNLIDNSVTGGHAAGDVISEIENAIGSDHEDVLVGNDSANRLEGGAGADRLDGGAGEDWVSYLESNTGVTVDLSDDTTAGGHAEGDSIANFENITGSAHADVLTGDAGANQLDGGQGDDLLEGGAGTDRLSGGAGGDTASYEHSDAAVTVRLHAGIVQGGDAEGDLFDALVSAEYTDTEGVVQVQDVPDIEHLRGSAHADTLAGDSRANRLDGGAGADRLYGGPGGGDDMLWGGPGADALYGGSGDDVLEGGPGADTLRGGPGADTVSYEHSDAAVVVHLHDQTVQGGHAEGDAIDGIENVTGSAYKDVLIGDGGANVLEGGADADRLDGAAGVDWVSYRLSDAGVVVRLMEGTGERGHAEGDVIIGIENVSGSAWNDSLVGGDGANYLAGSGGNDRLWGGKGDDILEGGPGADRMIGGAGTDTLSYRSSDAGVTVDLKKGTTEGGHATGDEFTQVSNIVGSVYRDVLVGDDGANRLGGNAGDDELKGGIGDDLLIGNLGQDLLYGDEGDDELRGSEGDDLLFGEVGEDDLYGGDGNDQLHGGDDTDQLFGGSGDDNLYGDGGDDELHGGEGSDRLIGNAGADRLDGGNGIDRVSYREADAGVTVNLADGTGAGGDAEGDVITNVENLVGSGYADILEGDGVANILRGLAGDDELRGNGGDDVLDGGADADRLDGGAGIDTASYSVSDAGISIDLAAGTGEGGHAQGDVLTGIENVVGSDYEDDLVGDDAANHLQGGNGRDHLVGGAGADRLDGGAGTNDTISYFQSDAGITVNLVEGTGQGGHAQGDIITGIENVRGTDYPDVLIGNDDTNVLEGFGGDDELRGGGSYDIMEGGAGADRLDGGDGIDSISYWFSDTGVTVNLEEGTGEGGHAQGDIIINVENIQGSNHEDVLIGDENDNTLRGLDGDDELYGGGGFDRMNGNVGADRLNGGAGTDWLYGNGGDLPDGSVDMFIFEPGNGEDHIIDFADNEDKIDLSAFNLSGFDELTVTTNTHNNPIIDLSEYGGGTIQLSWFEFEDLDATDFLF